MSPWLVSPNPEWGTQPNAFGSHSYQTLAHLPLGFNFLFHLNRSN